MDRSFAIRVLALYGPAALVALPWALVPQPRRRAVAAFLAFAWNVPTLFLVNIVAMQQDWWTFSPSFASTANVPAEVLLGWALLWGAAPVLLLPRASLPVTIAVLVLFDVVLMPLAQPVVVLSDTWLVGETVAILVALLPAQLLARWTVEDRNVALRATLLVIAFSATVLWVLPGIILEQTGDGWTVLSQNWRRYGGLVLQLSLVPAVMGVGAVQEFAVRGRGTPLPFDAPKWLVTSGPYAYVANPMQLSLALVLVGWGALLGSWWVALAGVMSVIYSAGLARSDERDDLAERFGEPWASYRRHVETWLPLWRPYHSSNDRIIRGSPARLYVASTCGECARVGRWFAARGPRGLEIVPAELHPTRDLTRVTYDPCDGARDEAGVAAIARALEHVHLGWAMVGWVMRLPVVVQVLQLLVDASGGEARLVPRAVGAGQPSRPFAPVRTFENPHSREQCERQQRSSPS
jgi:protein-S-isoprenylcysteine O-methyltransferase Ste14